MRTLILRDSEWLRGEGASNSLLYRPEDGRMCCLGIDARDRGIPENILRNRGAPLVVAAVDEVTPVILEYLNDYCVAVEKDPLPVYGTGPNFVDNKHHTRELMGLNDTSKWTDEERVEMMRVHFRQVGIEIEYRPDE